MIFGGEFIAGIDLVDISLWLFTLFFFGLVFYLQGESSREGYPSEQDTSGKRGDTTAFFPPTKKKYILPHDRGTKEFVYAEGDTRELELERTAAWTGSPYEPTGDLLTSGVGPGAYATREDIVDLTLEGAPRIAPLRDCPGFRVAEFSRNPIGMDVRGVDGETGGVVTDMWVDRSEAIFRYFEVGVPMEDGTVKLVLMPVPFARVVGGKSPHVKTEAITGAQFVKAPTTREALSVTRLEEDKISGFYGAGTLYATPERMEPIL